MGWGGRAHLCWSDSTLPTSPHPLGQAGRAGPGGQFTDTSTLSRWWCLGMGLTSRRQDSGTLRPVALQLGSLSVKPAAPVGTAQPLGASVSPLCLSPGEP